MTPLRFGRDITTTINKNFFIRTSAPYHTTQRARGGDLLIQLSKLISILRIQGGYMIIFTEESYGETSCN